MKQLRPTGGVIIPTSAVTILMTPNQIGSKPSVLISGSTIGTVRTRIAIWSMNEPSTMYPHRIRTMMTDSSAARRSILSASTRGSKPLRQRGQEALKDRPACGFDKVPDVRTMHAGSNSGSNSWGPFQLYAGGRCWSLGIDFGCEDTQHPDIAIGRETYPASRGNPFPTGRGSLAECSTSPARPSTTSICQRDG